MDPIIAPHDITKHLKFLLDHPLCIQFIFINPLMYTTATLVYLHACYSACNYSHKLCVSLAVIFRTSSQNSILKWFWSSQISHILRLLSIYHIVKVFFKGRFTRYLAHLQKKSKKCPILDCFQGILFISAALTASKHPFFMGARYFLKWPLFHSII